MTMTTRKFGIEIECVGADRTVVIAALAEIGIVCRDNTRGGGDIHATAPTWKIVLDGSVSGGWEMVSPILSGEEGIEQVRKVALVLVVNGASAPNTCGLHVHVDSRDLTVESIVNVARRYAKFEREIDAFMPRARNQNSMCRSVIGTNFDSIRQLNDLGIMSRYYKVNVAAFARHGTVEFRHHSGTVSGEKMENWIRFCTAFVEASIVSGITTVEAPSADTRESMAAEMFRLNRNYTEAYYVQWLGRAIDDSRLSYTEYSFERGNDQFGEFTCRMQNFIRRERIAAGRE
jgi:hypothetical protein